MSDSSVTVGSFGLPLPGPVRQYGTFIPPGDIRLIRPTEFLDHTDSRGVYREETRSISPWSEAFSNAVSSSQVVVDVPFEYRSSALSTFLGYSYRQGNLLKRVMPLAHPYWEFLRCRKILSCQGIKWRGHKPKEPYVIPNVGAAFPRPHFAEYDFYRMTLQFESCPFRFRDDGLPNTGFKEYDRFTYARSEPGYTSLFIEGGLADGAYRFDGNLPAPVAHKPAFTSGRNIPLSRPRILVTWYDVPLEFITRPNDLYKAHYPRLFAPVGHVNDRAFMGFSRNTLLYDLPIVEIRPNPLPVSISSEPSFLCDITFVMHYFNPEPKGYVTGGPPPTPYVPPDPDFSDRPLSYGHNLVPYQPNRKWYPASVNGDNTTRVYPSANFDDAFTAALNTDA